MREIALDTETTGLDPQSGHRIVEIGCVEMVDRLRTGRHFHAYLNPERDVPPEVVAVHGLTGEFLADKPLFSQVVEDFLDFVADAPLVIHNAAFDMKFLNAELERHGFRPLPTVRAVDTVVLARRKFPGSPVSLDALCRRFEIDLSARTRHGALLDAELLADVYLELQGGRQGMMQFQRAAAAAAAIHTAANARDIPERHFPVPEAERVAHRTFIQGLKNALWLKFLEPSA
jgi:DNA polymerase-3 subunit epsilon